MNINMNKNSIKIAVFRGIYSYYTMLILSSNCKMQINLL